MCAKLNEDFIYHICSIVDEIPYGYVATYGQIAEMAGYEKNSRLVGKALNMSASFGNFPCHRVVNSNGRLVPSWNSQKELLLKENVTFKNSGNVDLKKHKWNG